MIIDTIILAALCALQFIFKIPYFNLPLDRDYGAHGYIAHSWLLGRGVLYRDMYESKTPGIKLIYMFIIRWLGISRKSFRLFFALYNVLTTCAVYALAAKLSSPAAGCAAAALYAVYSSVPSLWWHFSNTESYYVLPAALSFLCLALGASPHAALGISCIVLAGFFGGTTFMFKQPSLISTAAPAVFYVLLYPTRGAFFEAGLYAAGFAVPVLVFFVYFTLMKETPWERLPFSVKSLSLLKKYLTTPLFKNTRATEESNRRRFRTIFSDIIFLLVYSFGGALYLLATSPSKALMIIPWIAMSFLAAIISRTYLAYHFIPPIPPMCILAGMALAGIGGTMVSPGHRFSAADAIACAAASVLTLTAIYHLVRDLLMPPELLGAFFSGEDQVYALGELAGKYIKSKTTEQDFVYSWGHEPEIYLWSERKAPVYCIYPPITNPAVFDKDHISKELAELLTNKPTYFVLTSAFGPFKEFEQFVVDHYTLEKKFDPSFYLLRAK